MPLRATPGPPTTAIPLKATGTPASESTLPSWWGITGGSALTPNNNYGPLFVSPTTAAGTVAALLPVAYGKVHIVVDPGAVLSFWTDPNPPSGTSHGFLNLAWCEGPIQSVDTIWGALTDGGAPLTAVDHRDYGGGDNTYYWQRIAITNHTSGGTSLAGSAGPFPNLANTAYSAIDVLSEHYYYNWLIFIPKNSDGSYSWAADVHGKLVYDPRTGLTAYSANPALIARDILTAYGQLTAAEIDDTSIANAANICDSAGLTCNIVFTTQTAVQAAVTAVLQTCNGILIQTNGRFGIFLDIVNSTSPVAVLDESNGDVWSLSYQWLSARDRYTRVAVSFVDSANGWVTNQTDNLDDPGIAAGTVPIKAEVVNAPGINTMAAAIALRDYIFNSQAISFRLSGSMSSVGDSLAQGMKITIKTLKGIDADFLIEQIAGDANGFFTFTAKPYDAAVYGSTPIGAGPPIVPGISGALPDVSVTNASVIHAVEDVPSESSTNRIFDIYQVIEYALPVDSRLDHLAIVGSSAPGAQAMTWDDMIASLQTIDLLGNTFPTSGSKRNLTWPVGVGSVVLEGIETKTYSDGTRTEPPVVDNTVYNTTRLIIRCVASDGTTMSAGVTIDYTPDHGSTVTPPAGSGGYPYEVPLVVPPSGTSAGQGGRIELETLDTLHETGFVSPNALSQDLAYVLPSAAPAKYQALAYDDALSGYPAGLIGTKWDKPWCERLMIETPTGVWTGRTYRLSKVPLTARIVLIVDAMPLTEGVDYWRSASDYVTITLHASANLPLHSIVAVYAYLGQVDGSIIAPLSHSSGATTANTWVAAGPIGSQSWRSVAWSPDLGIFAACNHYSGGGNSIITSSDGQGWTLLSTPVGKGSWNGIAWGNGMFVAVCDGDLFGVNFLWSTDGVTFTWGYSDMYTAHGIHAYAGCVIYAFGLFIAARSSETSPYAIFTSPAPNGTAWVPQTTPTMAIRAFAYSPALGIVCGVGNGNGNALYCATTPDGVTWTLGTPPCALGTWSSVVWDAAHNLFVSVGAFVVGGVSGIVAVSADGRHWTMIPAATIPGGSPGNGICYSANRGLLVIADANNTSSITVSTDAATGAMKTTPNCSLNAVATADAPDVIVAVGESGVVLYSLS